MPSYSLSLKGRKLAASDTMAFLFDKPAGFTYSAGQFADWTLADAEGGDDEKTHTFTISSAPFEDELILTTRLRDSAFKRKLKNAAPGAKVLMEGPDGEFVLPGDASAPIVFLTGGIGVTPARSIVMQATHDRLPHRITVISSNRRPEDAPFLDDFVWAQTQNPHFRLVSTITKPAEAVGKWEGETGRIDEDLLRKYVGDLSTPRFFLSGPPELVAALAELLKKADVDERNITTEDFEGY